MRKAIFGAVLVLVASTAHADNKKKAKVLYDEGLKRYNLAEYTEAIKAWKEAYLLSKRPLLLFNIGQAFRLSGDCKQAMTFYDSYQREESNIKNQEELDTALALCKDAKPADKPAATPPAVITKPANKPAPTPPVADKPVPDKPATLVPAPPVDKPADKPSTQVAQVEPQPQPQPVDTGEQTTGGGLRKIGIGVGIAGVVLGVGGIYFAVQSGKAASENDGHMGEWGQEQIDLETKGQRQAKFGVVLGISGAAALVAGGVMFAIGGPTAVETTSVTVVPTRGGAAFGVTHRF
jgi:hypothetical protein